MSHSKTQWKRRPSQRRKPKATASTPEQKAYGRQYYADHKEHVFDLRLQKQFGITATTYAQMVVEQEGVCAICRQAETKRSNRKDGGIRQLSVDHDHTTGLVRGLLCSKCNVGIGHFDDDAARMVIAAQYLTSNTSF